MADCLKRLLGHCCGCQDCPDDPWQEVTALSVQGRTVITEQGAVRVRAGNVPQPGQKVLLTPTGQTAGSRPQHPDRAKRREDEPVFVPSVPSYDSPQRPGAWGVTAFHVPKTEKGGVFSAVETAPKDEPPTRRAFVLDDGTFCPVYNTTDPDGTGADADMNPALAVDHDERVVRWVQTASQALPAVSPPHSSVAVSLDPLPGETRVTDAQAQAYGGGEKIFFPTSRDTVKLTVQGFGGERLEEVLRDVRRGSNGYFSPVAAPSRVVLVRREGETTGGTFLYQSYFTPSPSSALVQGWRYDSYRGAGWHKPYSSAVLDARFDEVDAFDESGNPTSGWFGGPDPRRTPLMPVNEAALQWQAVPVYAAGSLQYGDVGTVETYSVAIVGEYTHEAVFAPTPDPPDYASPEGTILGFVADGGRVTVRYGTAEHNGWVASYSDLSDEATLTAYGRTFNRGTWTAIREPPQKDDLPGFVRVLVLVEDRRAGTVTAVRSPEAATPDAPGTVKTVAWGVFAREVLRCEYFHFERVGDLWHSWPPERAWATCSRVANSEDLSDYDMRAFGAHDPWRDSIKRKPKEKPGPLHWYWPARPAKRPRVVPESAPKAPLGLTLHDVAPLYAVQRQEALKRGEPPALLPETATRAGQDVRRLVAKPELDDRTSTSGPLELTFAKLRDPRPPGPMFPGEQQGAALLLRLKTTADSITVDGKPTSIYRLGHNADDKRGWHGYVVPVSVQERYTLNFSGQCSRARLVARNFLRPEPEQKQEE